MANRVRHFPSIAESLEEARLTFQYQQNRFQNIEAKTSAFLTLNSILFAIAWIINGSWLAQICLLVSIFFSFKVLWLRQGKLPHHEDKWYDYAKLKKKKVLDQFLLDYRESIKNENTINEEKINDLKYVVSFRLLHGWSLQSLGYIPLSILFAL